jgi:hypothetical protein
MSQGRFGLGKFLSKFIETFPSNYMHASMILGLVLGHNTPALLFQGGITMLRSSTRAIFGLLGRRKRGPASQMIFLQNHKYQARL